MSDFNLGTVTAYGYAKDKGYTGTEDEFAALMASYADVAEQAAESATQAAASATTASTKASEAAASATAAASSKTAAETAQGGAETAAQTATTKAGEASASATTASGKATEATTAAGTATTKASEATTAATTATTKAGEASTSATNAAASATRAQEILDSIPADYSQLSDDVDDLKDGLNAVSNGNIYILGNLNVNKFINNSTGKLAPYSGWNATDFISCEGFSNLYIYSTEQSRGYNAFYTTNNENSFVSNFTVAVGDSVIPVPSNAKYFRLSNSSSAISNTKVYGVVRSEVANLNAQMYKLFPGIRHTDSITWESGYYSTTGKPNGSGSTTNIRSITTDFIQCGKGSTFQLLSVANGERARVSTYSAPNDDTFIERLTYSNTSVHTIQYDCFVRLNLYYTDGSEISDQSALVNNLVMNAIQLGFVTESMLDTTNENVYVLQNNVPTLQADWESRIQTIQTAQGTKFTFAVQTDTHYYTGSSKDSGNNLKLLSNYIGFDFVANLGDVIRGYQDTTIDTDENMRESMTEIIHRYVTGVSCPFMVLMGNHDNNPYSTTPFTNDEIWGRMFVPSFNTIPKVVSQTGLMYYYTDFNDVRVIVLNTQDKPNQDFGVGQDQIDWFANTALNTNKAVLVLSHVPLVNGWSVGSNYDSSFADIVSALESFKTNGGHVIGCFSGHTHTQEDKTVNNILYLTFRNGGEYGEVCQIDLANKTIGTFALGFSGDRSFSY